MLDPPGPIGNHQPWLPDETLFSWCGRYHRLAVNGLADITCLQLFGRRRLGAAHDLPAGLDRFVARTLGSLGNAAQIVQSRTLLPFYLPFKPIDLAEQAVSQMRADGIGSLKYRLGLLTSGLGAAHPLKACPACMEEDRRSEAVAYWHREHQLPSVWVCPSHGQLLLQSPLKLDQRARFQWVLPSNAGMNPAIPLRAASDAQRLLWLRLADFGVRLLGEPAGRLADPDRIEGAFRCAMEKQGWLGVNGRVSWRRLASSLDAHVSCFAEFPALALQMDLHNAQSQLTRILSARALTHPLRYLVWISWLFRDWDEFLTAYDQGFTLSVAEGRSSAPLRTGVLDDPVVRQALEPLLAGRESTTAVAKRLGVTPSTIAAWAAKAGMQTPRRPKVIHGGVWDQAVSLLQEGGDKSEVVQRCAISEVSVTRILRSVPGLQAQWHRVRHDRMQVNARADWQSVIAAGPWLGTTGLRRLLPAAYAWLYRNDRDWLKAQCKILATLPSVGNHADSRMRRADERYAVALRRLWLSSLTGSGAAPLLPDGLLLAAPGLKKVLKSPQRWPITMGVLREWSVAGQSFPAGALGL